MAGSEFSHSGSMCYCPQCGNSVSPNARACPECGEPLNGRNDSNENTCLPGCVGFCIPVVGVILYFVWKDSSPKAASAALKWSIISVVASFVISFAFGIIMLALGFLQEM